MELNIRKGENCFCATLHNILRNINLEIAEEEIFFLSGGLNFNYVPYNINNPTTPFSRFKFLSFDELLDRLSEKVNIQVKVVNSEDFLGGKEVNPNKLYLADVDTSKLLYFKRDMNFDNFRPPHCVILNRINGKDIQLVDSYVIGVGGNVEIFQGIISKKEFFDAINVIYEFCTDDFKIVSELEIRDEVKKNIEYYLKGGERNGVWVGRDAINKSIDDIRLYFLNENVIFTQMIIEMAFILKVNVPFVNHYLTRLLSIYKQDMEGLYDMSENINDNLVRLYNELIKLAYNSKNIEKCISMAKRIFNEQSKLFEKIIYLI